MATQAAPGIWKKVRGKRLILALAGVIVVAAALAVWFLKRECAVRFGSDYQAVLLSNGQVYYGRLEGYGTERPLLREVYYVQSSTNPQTREQTNVLLKRGREWHGPDRMYLNPSQILLVEPVGANSKVAELIRALKSQN